MENKSKINTTKYRFMGVLLLFVYYMCGIFGITLGFVSLFGGEYNKFLYLIIISICFIIFLLHIIFRRYLLQIAILVGAFTIFYILKNEEIVSYVSNVIRSIYKNGNLDTYEITYFLVLLSIVTAEFILGIYEIKHTFIYVALILFIILSSPLIGVELSFIYVALLFISVVGLHILCSSNLRESIMAVSIFTVILIFASIGSNFIADKSEDSLYDVTDNINTFATSKINEYISQRYADYDTGKVSRGNNYQTGMECIELWLSDKPNEPIYLKGFEGGLYSNGQWQEADESQFFNNLAFSRGWYQWGNYIKTMYTEIFYNANSSSETGNNRKSRTITINPLISNVKNRYYPYLGRWERLTKKENLAYIYSYYEFRDYNIIESNLDYETASRYEDMKATYEPYVTNNYLDIDRNATPQLYELCQREMFDSEGNRKFNTVEDVTEFIQSYLRDNATYTLTPGMAPLNEDIVDYFLFKNKRGYCVHFASAATLMYRIFGIPARYVTGYKISPSIFMLDDNNDYYGKALDRDAHAWVEIYENGKGWMPIEVTPSSIRTIAVNNEVDNSNTEITTEITTNTQTETTTVIVSQTNNITYTKYIIIILSIILLIALVILRRMYCISKIKNYDIRKYFNNIVILLNSMDIKCNGLEENFSDIVSSKLNLDKSSINNLLNIVYNEAYNCNNTSQKERAFVKKQYIIISNKIDKNLPIYKKLWYRIVNIYY